MENRDQLFDAAFHAAERAYAPYSHFRVGAALLCADGTIVTGCNVENRSYGLTICAERNAVAAAVALGKSEFVEIAVACPDSAEPVPPCGACRQVLSEFSGDSLAVIFRGSGKESREVMLGELLPHDSLHDLAQKIQRDDG